MQLGLLRVLTLLNKEERTTSDVGTWCQKGPRAEELMNMKHYAMFAATVLVGTLAACSSSGTSSGPSEPGAATSPRKWIGEACRCSEATGDFSGTCSGPGEECEMGLVCRFGSGSRGVGKCELLSGSESDGGSACQRILACCASKSGVAAEIFVDFGTAANERTCELNVKRLCDPANNANTLDAGPVDASPVDASPD